MTTATSNIITLKHQPLAATVKKYVWPTAYLLVAAAGLHNYIEWLSVNFILGIIAVAFCGRVNGIVVNSYKYGIACLAFALLNFLLPVKTVLYASVVCGVLFCIENAFGICNRLIILIAAFMCPVFQYIIDVFGFPIRLALTGWAAAFLSFTNQNITSQGNIILLDGNEFSVDPACMGLNMMVASVLCGIIVTSIYENKFNKQLSWPYLSLLIASFILLNIVANLMRIICLVLFKIPAENIFHEGIGLICMAVYVLLPSIFIAKYFISKWGKKNDELVIKTKPLNAKKFVYSNILLLLLIACSSFRIYSFANAVATTKTNQLAIDGYVITALPNGVTKLASKQELVYIKHIQGFYSSDHNPSICWRGSGYTFKKISIKEINGIAVYCALLEKGNEQLYTAWWYDDGLHPTISQLAWRWNEIKSQRQYSIVNITTASEKTLHLAVAKALVEKTFKPVIVSQENTSLLKIKTYANSNGNTQKIYPPLATFFYGKLGG